MSVDYESKAGIGYLIDYMDKIKFPKLKEKLLGEDGWVKALDELELSFIVEETGSYSYSKDETDLCFLILKKDWKNDNDCDFASAVSDFFETTFYKDDIKLVHDILVD